MHIVCLYFHYSSPDCPSGGRAYSLLRALGEEHEVTVFTGQHYYRLRQSSAFDWAPPGVTVRMLDAPYANQMGASQRLAAYLSFPAWAGAWASHVPDPDVFYAISTPLTTPAAAAVAARIRGVPWVLEVRDLWPDVPIQMGAVPSSIFGDALRWVEHRLYHAAAHVVAVSPDMATHIRSIGLPPSKVTMLPQGTDLALLDRPAAPSPNALRDEYDLTARHIVLYAGAFGRANDIPTLLAAADRLGDRPDTSVVFVGHGYHKPDIQDAVRRHSHVHCIPPQPRHRIMPWFRLAAVSVVSFLDRPVLGTNAPAKLFDSLAAGTPVIVTNPGWMTRLVRAHKCGWAVPPSAPEALAEQIAAVLDRPGARRAAGEHGAALARSHFDRASQAPQLASIFRTAIATS